MDVEFYKIIGEVNEDPEKSKERRMARVKGRLIGIDRGLHSLEWGKREYPGVKGSMTLDELEAFLKKEKERAEKEIIDNGGKP